MAANVRMMHHAQWGDVCFRKMQRSRTIKILVRTDKGVLVTLPLYETFTNAELFLYSHAQWVTATVKQMKEKKQKAQTLFTPETDFGTYSRKVQLVPETRKNVRVQITLNVVFIYYPAHRSIQDETLQSVIRKTVEYAWKVEAHEELPQRIAQLAAQCNLPYTRLDIKNTRSYWGLCTAANCITLSIHLMHLPAHLIDLVILHELCHTIHKNHGASFWELLHTLTDGKARQYSQELRKYSTRVY